MTKPLPPLSAEEWDRLTAARKAYDMWVPGSVERWASDAFAALPRIDAERLRFRAVAIHSEAFVRLLLGVGGEPAVRALDGLIHALVDAGHHPGAFIDMREAPAAPTREPERLIEDSAPAAVASRPADDEPAPDDGGMPKKQPGEHADSYTKRVIKWRALRPRGV